MAVEEQPARTQHLNRLEDLRREREDTLYAFARAEFAAVLDARFEGATWAQIGQALGVSAQAVQQKYRGRTLPARHEPQGMSDEELEILIDAEIRERKAPPTHLTLLR